jgi:hypothetical protein
MRREVYLFGVHHNYQFPDSKIFIYASHEERDQLSHSLVTAISEHSIRGIAEEMSLEALEKRSISGGSMLCRFATQIALPYRYCDLKPYEPDEQREQTWIDELGAFDTFPVLFVLGASHVDSFAHLLTKSGLPAVHCRTRLEAVFRSKRGHLTRPMEPMPLDLIMNFFAVRPSACSGPRS